MCAHTKRKATRKNSEISVILISKMKKKKFWKRPNRAEEEENEQHNPKKKKSTRPLTISTPILEDNPISFCFLLPRRQGENHRY